MHIGRQFSDEFISYYGYEEIFKIKCTYMFNRSTTVDILSQFDFFKTISCSSCSETAINDWENFKTNIKTVAKRDRKKSK